MKHLKINLAILFLLFNAGLFAQGFKKGFIVQTNGDTLHGLVRETNFDALSLSVEFKPTRKEEARQFSANDLQGFGFKGGEYFESHPVRFSLKTGSGWTEVSGQRFLYRLAAGTISLYELRDGGESPLFIKKDGQPLQLLCFDRDGQPEYRSVIRIAVSDCDQVVFPEKLKLEPNAVRSLIEDYNDCERLGKRHQLPFVQVWGFGGITPTALVKKYEGMGKGLATEIRPFKKGFMSRWTMGFDYENLSYKRDDGWEYQDELVHEFAVKTRFFLPTRNAHFSPYGLFGSKRIWRESETGYTFENGDRQIDLRLKEKDWRFQIGVGVHAQFGRHLFKLEVPFDRSVNLRLGYGVALWQ